MNLPAMTLLAATTFALATPQGYAADGPAVIDGQSVEANDLSNQRDDSAADASVTSRPPAGEDTGWPDEQPAPILLEFSKVTGQFFHGLTVRWDGSAEIHSFARIESGRGFAISLTNLDQLTTALERARFGTLRSRYGRGCPDCSVTSITWAGRTVTIRGGPGAGAPMPPQLDQAVSLLNRLVFPGYGRFERRGHRIP